MMSDLPKDLKEEILSRVPVKSLRAARSTCKNWNKLSKKRSFTKKHLAQEATATEREVVMVMNSKVYLISINLNGIHNNVDPSITRRAELVSLNDSDLVDISEVYHCDGVLLCITEDITRFVVWNPYWGQTLWLKPRSPHPRMDWYTFAIGYESSKSRRNYKVLRFVDMDGEEVVEYQIYEFNSKSWRVLDITADWEIEFYARGVSLQGNTYWFAQDKEIRHNIDHNVDFLICFDFTSERFGPRLHLPFHSLSGDTVTLSSVREEQLAVLFQSFFTLRTEIWVTTKIEPKVVSWSKLFLEVDMLPLTGFDFGITKGSFVIDEEKKVVVVFDKGKDEDVMNTTRNTAYIIGEDGYYREVDLGESTDEYPLVCSYVPSSVQIK